MEQELKKEILEQIEEAKGYDSICIFFNTIRFNVDLKDPKLISEIKDMLKAQTQHDWVFSGKNLETLSFDKRIEEVERTNRVDIQVQKILQNMEQYVVIETDETDEDEISCQVQLDEDFNSQEMAEIDNEISSEILEYLQDHLQKDYYITERLDEYSSETDKIFYRFKVEKESDYDKPTTSTRISEKALDLIYELKQRKESNNDVIIRVFEEYKKLKQ